MDNRDAARTVFAVAAILEAQGINPYRVRAYRRAALSMLRLPEPAAHFASPRGELELPWLGSSLRRKLGELVCRGEMQFHQELLAELPRPVRTLLSVPGIGPKTAQRLVDEAGILSLQGLALAGRQGKLRKLRGIGPRRELRLTEAAEAMLAEAA